MIKFNAFLSFLCFFLCSCSTTLQHKSSETQQIKAIQEIVRDFKEGHKTRLTILKGGLSGAELYTFDISGKRYVLKAALKTESLYRRISELQMHKFTSSNKIAPKLIFVDNEENPFVVVMEYIDGRLFDFSDFKKKEIMDKIIKYLKIIHTANTKLNLSKVSMMEETQHFVNQLKKEKVALPSEFDKWHQSLIEEYKKVQYIKLVPAHGDLWTKNILIGKDGNVYFIDFQESRYDDPLCDLGYFLYGSGIEDLNDIEMFTSKYLRRKATKKDMENVLFYIKASAFIDGLYRFLWIKNIKTSKQLDKILLNIKHNASFYFQRGDYSKDEFDTLNSEDKVKYVLSFFKGFLEIDMKMRQIK